MKKVSSEKVATNNDTTVVALAVVIVCLLTGIVVYCIVSYYRKTQGEKVVQPKQPRIKYLTKQENEFELANNNSVSQQEIPTQFDASKHFDAHPSTASKLCPTNGEQTFHDLMIKDGDTERLEKSMVNNSSNLNESTNSELHRSSLQKKTPGKKPLTDLQANEDVEIMNESAVDVEDAVRKSKTSNDKIIKSSSGSSSSLNN